MAHKMKFIAVMTLGLSLGACAGDAAKGTPVPAPAPGPLGGAAEPGAEVKAAEKPWMFDMKDRRDPFTFITKEGYEKLYSERPTPGPGGKPPIDQNTIQAKKAEAEKFYAQAEAVFMDLGKDPGKVREVIDLCEKGLGVFDHPQAAQVDEWREITERLRDLRKAAERIRLRQEAEKKFKELNLRLTGVIAREKNSTALINGRPARRGDVVASAENFDVVVDDIRSDQVVFVFQGFKLALNVAESAAK